VQQRIFLNDLSFFLFGFIQSNSIIINQHLSYFVDVRTQAMYQLLDSGFIGLIFSCYNEDANKVGLKHMIIVRCLAVFILIKFNNK